MKVKSKEKSAKTFDLAKTATALEAIFNDSNPDDDLWTDNECITYFTFHQQPFYVIQKACSET